MFFQPNTSFVYVVNTTFYNTYFVFRFDIANASDAGTYLGAVVDRPITVDWNKKLLFQARGSTWGFMFFDFDGHTIIQNYTVFGSSISSGLSVAIDYTRQKLYALSQNQLVSFDYTDPYALPTLQPTQLDACSGCNPGYSGRLTLDEAGGFLYYILGAGLNGSTLMRYDLNSHKSTALPSPSYWLVDSYTIDFESGMYYSAIYSSGHGSAYFPTGIYSSPIPSSSSGPLQFSPLLFAQSISNVMYDSGSGRVFWQSDYHSVMSAIVGSDNSISNRINITLTPPTGVSPFAWSQGVRVLSTFVDPTTQQATFYLNTVVNIAGNTIWFATASLSAADVPLVASSVPTVFAPDFSAGTSIPNPYLAVSPDSQLFGYVSGSTVVIYNASSDSYVQQQLLPDQGFYVVGWDLYWATPAQSTEYYTMFVITHNGVLVRVDSATSSTVIFAPPAGHVLRTVRCDSGGKLLYVGVSEDPATCSVCKADVYRVSFDGSYGEKFARVNAVDSLQLQ